MSLHCPTCGAADDGTVNGWVHRAYRSEFILDKVRQYLEYRVQRMPQYQQAFEEVALIMEQANREF